MNILITSAGRRVSLVNYFKKELKLIFPTGQCFASDANPRYSAACQVGDQYFEVPYLNHPDYIKVLLEICTQHGVKLIVPTIDTELLLLATHKAQFEAQGITVLVSDLNRIQSFRDKRATHIFFESIDVQIAKEYTKENYQLPIYIKPYDGSRSVDNYLITEESQLTDYHLTNDKLMFLEYLDHSLYTEYTLDLYYDRQSELKAVVPRKRIEVREGEVNKAITKKELFLKDIWTKFNKIEGLFGCITLQIFVHNTQPENYYGIEINPRFGGGYPLSYLAGANFPKWILEEYFLNNKIQKFEDWEDNLMMLRYDHEVLIHDFKENA
ncbi:MAG: hypothetical protein RL607_530 [Bacteroidota bacterium]|jgi:carbamoyl-phosphate synthase large subunit